MSAMIDVHVTGGTNVGAAAAVKIASKVATFVPDESLSTLSSCWIQLTAPSTSIMENRTAKAAPFALQSNDLELLTESDGFAILRNHLADHYHYEYATLIIISDRMLPLY